jgi:predicted HicB family RNase H-like nuclease
MTKDCITYEGKTIDELEKDFIAGIESYIEGCMELGITPRKAYNGVLNIRIPSDVHSRIAMIAENNGTSINTFIKEAIQRQVEFAR